MNARPWSWLGAVLLGTLAMASHADEQPDSPLPWSSVADRRSCTDDDSYLWVTLPSGDACLRYFGPANLRGQVPIMIISMGGDRDGLLNTPPDQIPDNTRTALSRRMDRLTQRSGGVPVVMLARPGTYGSSGDHRRRRRLIEEFAPIDAALDALKRRYGVTQFVLWGHSGGATAAAAMLTLGRTDLRCVVMTSAAFAYAERVRLRLEMTGQGPPSARALAAVQGMYDPLAHIGGVVRDDRRQIFVLGNAADNVTPFVLQRRFAEALNAAGHRVAVREVQTLPPEYHDMQGQPGLETARDCAR